MKRRYIALIGAAVLCLVLTATAATLLMQPGPAPQHTLQQAVTNAIVFCEGLQEPDALLMLDVMHRRFGIEAFADSLQRYDQLLAGASETQQPHLRVFRRIADPNNPIRDEDWQAISGDVDFFIVPALYSDRQALPAYYSETLDQAANQRGLYLTHTLLACTWLQENGREEALPESFRERVHHATAELIDNDSVVSEVELEAAAFLYLAGQGALVDKSFADRGFAVQNSDGGWPRSSDTPGDSYWHASILGLLFLLHVENPASSYPPMLASS